MKEYKREYEKVEANPDRIRKFCDIAKIAPFSDSAANTTVYSKMFKDTIKDFGKNYFDNLVKFMWLSRKFTYNGKHRKKPRQNGYHLDRAWGMFLRHWIGFDNRIWFTRASIICKIASYMDDFFPNFEEGNPFTEKYEYPFKYITLDYLYVVKDLPERMELLRAADAKQMPYTEYLDWLSNYVGCYNAEAGKEIYRIMFINPSAPHIKIVKDK